MAETSELEAQIADLKAQVAAEQATNAQLRQEAAQRRIDGRTHQLQAHVLKDVLGKHNISFDADGYDYSKHSIKDGAVVGDVDYTPPNKPRTPSTPPTTKAASNGNEGLTLEAIDQMSQADIRKVGLDKVLAVLEQSNEV